MGHEFIDATLTYIRAHDQTVAKDYYQAMDSVENHLNLLGQAEENAASLAADGKVELLALPERFVAAKTTT